MNKMTKIEMRPVGAAVSNVYYTEHLDQFRRISTNREIGKRVKHIVNSMKKDGVLFQPIIVDTHGYVIDGEHRLFAARQLGFGIYFVVDERCTTIEKSEKMMITFNKYQESWKKLSFLDSNIKAGKIHYINLGKFMNEFPEFSITDCIMLLNNSQTFPSEDNKDFENGDWKHKSIEVAREWGKFIMRLKEVFPNGYRRAIFFRSMIHVLSKYPEFETERFITKCKQCPQKLQVHGDRRNNYFMIDDIYNYKVKDNRLEFRL